MQQKAKMTEIWNSRIWTPSAPFLHNRRSCCGENTDPVQKARLLRLRSKDLEPNSSSHKKYWFCSGFLQRL